jgi:hypothetical protein
MFKNLFQRYVLKKLVIILQKIQSSICILHNKSNNKHYINPYAKYLSIKGE